MVCVKTLLTPAKERKKQSGQCDSARNARDSKKPSGADGKPCTPMYDAVLVKGELWIVVPSDKHHEAGNKCSYQTDDAESNPTEMESTRTHHLTRQSSATAGGSERGLQRMCFHNVMRGIKAASGWLQRLVRPVGYICFYFFPRR